MNNNPGPGVNNIIIPGINTKNDINNSNIRINGLDNFFRVYLCSR